MERMMLETYIELYELHLQEQLQMFIASTAARKDEAEVILTDDQNDFLFADASRMEEIKELSANICLMAIIQPTNIDSEAGPSYNSAFLSEVQTPSTRYVNPLFASDKQEQQYMNQPKIINNTIGDDQIDTNIIFNAPNDDVNSGSVKEDTNVQQSYELEQLARNVSDAEVEAGISIGEIGSRVFAVEGQVQVMASQMVHSADRFEQIGAQVEQGQQTATQRDEVIAGLTQQVQDLQAAVQQRDTQIQQLQTTVSEMSSRESTLMQCILGMDMRLADLERRPPGPQ
ncbi:hypothetical protein Tco_1236257 [Tanacetum coccineum]